MTLDETVRYIESFGWSAAGAGLGRTETLLKMLGNPEKRLKCIHVAGSNGKGSVCAMLEAILRSAHFCTGLYSSPHIQDFRERIQVMGEWIPAEELIRITEKVRSFADAMEDHPSQFEITTAVAMEYFAMRRCDIVVLETGMGGELDSTNVIPCPEAAVITNIGLEHTEYLGKTLPEIASAKAGIIKSGCHAVCYESAPEAVEVIRKVCAEKAVPFYRADFSKITPVRGDLDGQDFLWEGEMYRLSLPGAHQLGNAAAALETVRVLRGRGWEIPREAVVRGLGTVRWPARFQILSHHPVFILDGAHNPQCAEALAKSFRKILPGRKAVILTGVLADKDYVRMTELMRPLARVFICVTPPGGRALPAEKLAACAASPSVCTADPYAAGTRTQPASTAVPDIPAGIRAALEAAGEDGVVLAFGSLYLAGEILNRFSSSFRSWLRSAKIAARDSLTPGERREKSEIICRKILSSEECRRAETVMLYRFVRGEVQLTLLEEELCRRKRLVYPLCQEDRRMLAVEPGCPGDGRAESCWKKGPFGIMEPDPKKGRIVPPEEIDLVICPCTGFDSRHFRLGMGGGYYDRFLPECGKAVVWAAAFEVQRIRELPEEAWDAAVDAVITEK